MHALQKELKKYSSPDRKRISMRFFKTGKGQYGEGDQFIGVTVPDTRKVVKPFAEISFVELASILDSPIHEERMAALLILVEKYAKAKEEKTKKEIVDFYLKHRAAINNWDLVDLSAHQILGHFLLKKDRKVLYQYAQSKNLWERRMAVVATFAFIRQNQFEDTFTISEMLLHDREDLMHKACGWMLREVGKRDEKALESFLNTHVNKMPRTMLRYAIERFPESKRKMYLMAKAE